MRMAVIMRMAGIKPAGTCAEMVTQVTILDIAARGRHTLPLDMMVMAFLRQANLILKTQHLRAIFAHGAVHVVAAIQDFTHPVSKGGNHFRMIIQIACLENLDIWMCICHFVGKPVDAVDQNAREQEVRENDNRLKPGVSHVQDKACLLYTSPSPRDRH